MSVASGNLLLVGSGGPTAVVNASLAAAARTALDRLPQHCRVLGTRFGAMGLLQEDFIDLTQLSAQEWKRVRGSPGCVLGSSRQQPSETEIAQAVDVCRRGDIRYIAFVGGNGTMKMASQFAEFSAASGHELLVAGIPKTIDNDLLGTDFCPGYGSCLRYFARAALDLGADVRSLPTPVSILEVMGRHAGWLTAGTVLARQDPDDAPQRVYLPEVPLSLESFLDDVDRLHTRCGWVVVAVAEGVCDDKGRPVTEEHHEPASAKHGGTVIGDTAATLARLVTRRLGLRARSEKPGLVGRAASHLVSKVDRSAAERAGRFAVRRLLGGDTGFMVSLRRLSDEPFRFRCETVPLAVAAGGERLFPDDFLNPDGQPSDSFLAYARPLSGGPFPEYARLY